MKNEAIFLKVDGTMERKPLKPTLKKMQEFVEGYIEPVDIEFEGRRGRMVCNEEGRIKGLPLNRKATILFNATHPMSAQPIVGNVIILLGFKI